MYQALEINHEVIPVLNKIDLPASDIENQKEIEDVVGIETSSAIPAQVKLARGSRIFWRLSLTSCQLRKVFLMKN